MNKLNWREVLEGGISSRVMRLVHLAARMDETDEAAIAGEIFREKRDAYEDQLTIEAANVGCAGRVGRTPPDVMSEMRAESDMEAKSIINTYNYDLAHAIRHIRQEVPTANRHVYAYRLRKWEEERTVWKSRQIALWNTTKWVDRATRDFYENNKHLLLEGYAIVQPQQFAVCDVCKSWVNRGRVTMEEAKRMSWPAHLNCPHHWVYHYDRRKKVDCDELWVGMALPEPEVVYGLAI